MEAKSEKPVEMSFVYRDCEVEMVPWLRGWGYRLKVGFNEIFRDKVGVTYEDARSDAEKRIDFELES